MGALQSLAASISCPLKILIGSQSGERASTEDSKEWAKTCNARNTKMVKPNIRRIIREKLVKFGVLPKADWYLLWADLTESSTEEKLGAAEKMSKIIKDLRGSGEPDPWTGSEVRETAGWEALKEEKIKPRPKPDPSEDEKDEETD
jgi:hypothetical protein